MLFREQSTLGKRGTFHALQTWLRSQLFSGSWHFHGHSPTEQDAVALNFQPKAPDALQRSNNGNTERPLQTDPQRYEKEPQMCEPSLCSQLFSKWIFNLRKLKKPTLQGGIQKEMPQESDVSMDKGTVWGFRRSEPVLFHLRSLSFPMAHLTPL